MVRRICERALAPARLVRASRKTRSDSGALTSCSGEAGTDPRSVSQERQGRKNVIVGCRRQDQQLRHAHPPVVRCGQYYGTRSVLPSTRLGRRCGPDCGTTADGRASRSSGRSRSPGRIVVGLAYAGTGTWFGDSSPFGVYGALGVVLAASVLALAHRAAGDAAPEGFVPRVSGSIAGAVLDRRGRGARRRARRRRVSGIDSEHV